ncbi:hypothetical protein NKH18_42530 [Streptomyces sp. M10(2022)]
MACGHWDMLESDELPRVAAVLTAELDRLDGDTASGTGPAEAQGSSLLSRGMPDGTLREDSRSLRRRGPGSPGGLALEVHRQALRTPRAVALTDGDARLDYAALDSSAAAVAQALRRAGVAPGRRWRWRCRVRGGWSA